MLLKQLPILKDASKSMDKTVLSEKVLAEEQSTAAATYQHCQELDVC